MKTKNRQGQPGNFALIFGLFCLVVFLILVLSGDFDALFRVTPGRKVVGIPVFMILILGIVGFILYPDTIKRSKKKTGNDT